MVSVKVDALAILKIIRHCQSALNSGNSGSALTGQLLGLDKEESLEVTFAFPLPSKFEDEDIDEDEYQMEMMRSLRNVNLDGNTVGWYQSCNLASFISTFTVETQAMYQESISSSVFLVYDPVSAKSGCVPIKAFRLDEKFLELYRSKKLSTKVLIEQNFGNGSIFNELPIEINKSLHMKAFHSTFQDFEGSALNDVFCDVDERPCEKSVSQNIEHLSELVDDLSGNLSRLFGYTRGMIKQQQSINYLKQRKRNESGSDELTQEEIASVTKSLHEPSRLDLILSFQQVQESRKLNEAMNRINFCKLKLLNSL